MINSLKDTLPIGPDDETLMFLPLAHIFARILEFTQIERGYAVTFAESIDKVAENLAEARPTFMASVPRIFEKIYAKINGATGNYNAHFFVYPDVDWIEASNRFISHYLELTPLFYTTQINPNSHLSALLHAMIRIASILIVFN